MSVGISLNEQRLGRSAATGWLASLFCFACLYSLLLLPLWDIAKVSLSSVVALLFAVAYRGIQLSYRYYRPVLICYFLLLALNCAQSVMPLKSLSGGLHLLRGLGLFLSALLLVELTDAGQRQRWLRLLVGLCGLGYLLLLFMLVDADNRYRTVEAWAADYAGNLHNLANVAAITLLAAAALVLRDSSRCVRLAAALVVLICLLLQVAIQSEGSMIALAVAALAGVAMLRRGLWQAMALLGITGLVLTLQLFYLWPELLTDHLGVQMDSFIIRTELYRALLEQWQQAPWFGWGVNTYKYLPVSTLDGISYLYPHHIYLEALFSLGVVGGVLLLTLFWQLARRVDWQAVRHDSLTLTAYLLLCYFAAKGMTDMKFLSAQTFGVFALCLGLMSRLPAGGGSAGGR
ncbi:O-antigen ligase family protein [Marinobacterium arenosum]|uniref:O-antigen ligase family protein n=1 Tax=Marinobacterium arenosum TaxID=2862496 RepID=UPI001C96A7F4|nr:O-antigen ligase family protein [Marinobacterium arenosum]MBY4676435.1 O-antigen ligase family protein [Marinobacterium arenosum]